MSRLLQKRSPSPASALGRSSFSSIRERDNDYAQSFTSTRISSYISLNPQGNAQRWQPADEAAVADDSCSASPIHPSSPNVGTMPVPCASFESPAFDSSLVFLDGTAEYDGELQGCMKMQNSLLELGSLHLNEPYSNMEVDYTKMESDNSASVVDAKQPLELLPLEVFRLILQYLIVDIPPNGIDRRNVDLVSLLVTSRPLYAKTLEALYRRVTVPHSRIFQKFLAQIETYPVRGSWVRRLDFSHFNPISLFSSFSKRDAARNLTSETLLRCLNLTSDLHEFLVQDYLDGDLSVDVLQKLLTGLPQLKALDLCGSSSVSFRNAFTSLITYPSLVPSGWSKRLSIQRLSLHKCISLTPAVFEFLLPKLGGLTHLDVAGTRITDAALHSIPSSARLTHLNLAKCSLLSADSVIDFLAHHPAVNHDDGLVFLSLSFDATISELFNESDISRLLSVMPKSLKSLSLKGSKMNPSHLPQLRMLSKHLEELAIGRGLTLGDVKALVVPPQAVTKNCSVPSDDETWVQPSLRYIDLTDMGAETFDLSYLYLDSQLLDRDTVPLEVVEVSEDVFKRVSKSKGPLNRMGWRVSEIGARSWLVRGSNPTGSRSSIADGSFAMEDGQRPWKMGAQSWGMRKLPVAHAKVGGMYGSYMFGRKL